MKPFFDPSDPVLRPADIVTAFTRRKPEELALPSRAIVVFGPSDLALLVRRGAGRLVEAWSGRRTVYLLGKGGTAATRSGYGGSNIASLVEEFVAFGVREFVVWGYCGAIARDLVIGDLVVAESALREEGVSFHYLARSGRKVPCPWQDMVASAADRGFRRGLIWTTDALYRETSAKIERFRRQGVAGVEMETASLYAVCDSKGVQGVALLVVSDIVGATDWRHGFDGPEFKRGVRALADVICGDFIV